jgi:hypothetical protein
MNFGPFFTNIFSIRLIRGSTRVYTRGGQTFLFTGQIQKIKSNSGLKKKFHSFLSQKRYVFKVFSYKMVYKSSFQGPQKMFGGPHAARGPQFGHVWYIR